MLALFNSLSPDGWHQVAGLDHPGVDVTPQGVPGPGHIEERHRVGTDGIDVERLRADNHRAST
ncbi:hypothetical protein JB92DRAFT_2976297 [Gautieria morchelliformis]|nr:hypothetical protein JB92DRAFT_2976297 [Gautieria morchelliformis]